ncbi:MAG TPA: TAXI family TRAP transporter solute-binding subunit [Syntrophales bacterium]|nr:TAXI family TRAP transporter solute-binding subunit [Syntrophales bacterium]HPQ43585.1 TAXI family TRAP transporter solute-binding subunit [Syntrophales bacterium]
MLKKRNLVLVIALIVTCSMLFVSPSFAAKKSFFAIATGGTGGTYYPLGGVLAQALSNKLPDLIITAQSGNASVANCNLIKSHQIESAFVQNNVAYYAYNGIKQFEGKPVENLRAIASLYPETIQIVAREGAGIKTIADLKGKKLVPGDRGSGTEVDCLAVLAGVGLTYDDFSNVDWLSFAGAAQRLKDRQADVTFVTAGWPTASITELATTSDITLVPLDDATIAKIIEKNPFYAKVVIPAGTYKGVDVDTPAITTMAQWVVDAAISEEVVYNLTKALWEKGTFVLRKSGEKAAEAPSGAEIMAQAHVKGKDVTLKTALDGVAIPLHPGALKFYREKGLK